MNCSLGFGIKGSFLQEVKYTRSYNYPVRNLFTGGEYAKRYRTELALYEQAERYLKEHLESDTKLRPKAWKTETVDPTVQKDSLYGGNA